MELFSRFFYIQPSFHFERFTFKIEFQQTQYINILQLWFFFNNWVENDIYRLFREESMDLRTSLVELGTSIKKDSVTYRKNTGQVIRRLGIFLISTPVVFHQLFKGLNHSDLKKKTDFVSNMQNCEQLLKVGKTVFPQKLYSKKS